MNIQRKIIVVQHVAEEGLGLLERVLREAGVSVENIGPHDPVPVRALEEAGGLVVLGGPMGVYDADRYPRLNQELELLRLALERGTPILGICLGSQLLAAALGARVYPGPSKEIGWYDVTLEPAAASDALFRALPSTFKALHWHGDVFEVPPGAVPLARSALTACQGFSIGSAWGLLFHLEAGPPEVERMARAFPDELAAAGVQAGTLVGDAERFLADAERLGTQVFTRWVEHVR